jgi:CRISPR-associated protein Cmr6
MNKYYPADSREAVQGESSDNFHYKINFNQMKDHMGNKGTDKFTELKAVKGSNSLFTIWNKKENEVYSMLYQLSHNYEVQILKGTIDGKFVHGLGMHHVRETAITLHSLYGMPYIPASSFKGSLRTWFINAVAEGKEDAVPKDYKMLFEDIFGSQENKGKVIFFDLFCFGDIELNPEVLTAHFDSYYQDKAMPTDDKNPTPVKFLVIEEAEFTIPLAVEKGRVFASGADSVQILQILSQWIKTMLIEQGIGSKTASGFGRFKDFKDDTKEIFEKLKIKEKKKEKDRIEAQKEADKEKIMASMSEEERFVYYINQLDMAEKSQNEAKSIIYTQAIEYAEKGNLAPAQALKEYWQKTNSWVKVSKKQEEKVKKIKSYLNG